MTTRAAHSAGRVNPLAARARRALDAWEARSGVAPTSSVTGAGAVAELERGVAAACGTQHALALPSGTLALRVALQAVGVGPGTNVVVPALDWPAAASAVLSLGAEPRAADAAAGSLLIDPEAIARRIDARTRAVVATHVAGLIADVQRIAALCDARGVALVEDACQAFGARRAGRPVGGLGDAGVISLGPGKLLDAGEGGVLVTDDAAVFRAAVAASQHPARQLRSGVEPRLLGLAARVHPLAAILAWAELDGIGDALARRRANALALASRARGLDGVALFAEAAEDRYAWPCVPALLAPGGERQLAAAGIGACPLGCEHVGRLLGEHDATPHADAVHALAVRLFAAPARAAQRRSAAG